MNFEQAIRAEFATQHLMAEQGLSGPLELFLHMGYDLFLKDKNKYMAIQELYKKEIEECLKNGMGNSLNFKPKELNKPKTDE